MTFPKKKSRTIVVGERQYRWLVAIANPGESLTVRIQRDKAGPACQLQADVWETHCGGTVTPAVVESLIVGSLKAGWNPDSTGTFKLPAEQTAALFP